MRWLLQSTNRIKKQNNFIRFGNKTPFATILLIITSFCTLVVIIGSSRLLRDICHLDQEQNNKDSAHYGHSKPTGAEHIFFTGETVTTRRRQELQYRVQNAPSPQFVFLVGTEGSGHHLWKALIEASPMYAHILKFENFSNEITNLSRTLHNRFDLEHSLFSSPCTSTTSDETHHENGIWNGSQILNQTVGQLRHIAAQCKTNSTLPVSFSIPLNGWPDARRETGMMSYPNFSKLSRRQQITKRSSSSSSLLLCPPWQYPNLVILQRACHLANVSCGFILQYRSVLDMLISTAFHHKRHSLPLAIQIMTSMLYIIVGQLRHIVTRQHDKNKKENLWLWCWNTTGMATATSRSPLPALLPFYPLGKLLGWSSPQAFQRDLAGMPVNDDKSAHQEAVETEVIPKEYNILLESLHDAHDQLAQFCQQHDGQR